MVGVVIVSHSKKVAEGIRELCLQMSANENLVVAVGGLEDGSIGTDSIRILDGLKKASSGDGVVVLVDMGSAIMSTEMAIELLEEDIGSSKIVIADAPILEGSIMASVEASAGSKLSEVLDAAIDSKNMSKS